MPRTTRPNQKKQGIANRDTFLRINYMYQAAHLILTQNPGNTEVIRFYAYSLKSMAKKQVLRLHPDIKRTICKKCYMLLVPGVTTTIRKKGKKQEHMVVRCLECQTPKRFPTKADYKLWSEQPQAWFAMFPPDAPIPVPASPTDHQGAANDQKASKLSCSHRRCRRFPRCKNQLRRHENSSKTFLKSEIMDSQEDQLPKEQTHNVPGGTDSLENTSTTSVVIHNGEIQTGETNLILDSAQNSPLDSVGDGASLCQITDCDRNPATDISVSKGIKRQLNDSSHINSSLKKRKCTEKDGCPM